MHIHITNSYVFYLSVILNISFIIVFFLFFRRNKLKNIEHNDLSEYVTNLVHTINAVRYGNLLTRLKKHSDKDLNEVSNCINRMIETLNDREKMIVEYQSELSRQNDFLETIINSLSDGIIIIDNNCKILQASKNIYNWFLDKNIKNKDIFKYIKISDNKELQDIKNTEIFIKNSDRSFEASTINLKSEEHKNKYLIVIKDVTARKEIETLKEDFVATLTHDLKVPIVAEANIISFFLQEKFGKIDEKQREALLNMQNSNKELLELVHIVLDTYKTSDKGISLNKTEMLLSDVIEEVITEMTPIANMSNNKLISKLQKDIVYPIDSIQFKRVLKNLIQNAILYGQVDSDIEIKLLRKDNHIKIFIKDFGKGISKEDVDKIFNKYYSASKKFRKIGTGLGLYLSKEIVKAHGGNLSVQSEQNKYTEFCITFDA